MNKTKIEYLDFTWNPLAMECTKVSPGCQNCWHLKMAVRLAGNKKLGQAERDAWAGKCPRCWRRVADTGASAEHPELCGRCAAVVGGEA